MASTNIDRSSRFTQIIAWSVASGLGSGFSKYAPGTAGTFSGIILWFLAHRFFGESFSIPVQLLVIVFFFIVGLWATKIVLIETGREDPGVVVVDEWLGVWVTSIFLTAQSAAIWWIASFFLFRFFDILKPPPASNAENIPGAMGVILDDIVAGIFSLIVLTILMKLF